MGMDEARNEIVVYQPDGTLAQGEANSSTVQVIY